VCSSDLASLIFLRCSSDFGLPRNLSENFFIHSARLIGSFGAGMVNTVAYSDSSYLGNIISFFHLDGFMESYWRTQKNSIIDMMNGKEIPLPLTPCLKIECDMWDGGWCAQIRKAGKSTYSRLVAPSLYRTETPLPYR